MSQMNKIHTLKPYSNKQNYDRAERDKINFPSGVSTVKYTKVSECSKIVYIKMCYAKLLQQKNLNLNSW
jgi:hypothetical protein